MPKVPHPPKRAELTVTLPKVLDGRPMTRERAQAIADAMPNCRTSVYIDDMGTPSIDRDQLIQLARDAERAAERARW